MILQREIIDIARKKLVKNATIDKDWVLGHFLNAFYSFEDIAKNFVFKGGTCLRKCYFEDYRFSEDLDFTLLDESYVIDVNLINKILRKAEENSGIKFSFERSKLQKSDDIEQGYEIKIKYWGADHKKTQEPLPVKRWQTSIKIDISHTEEILDKVEQKAIIHSYSDSHLINSSVPVYSLKEIITEKIRSLMQRNRPRDIYDLWFLNKKTKTRDYPVIREMLFEKCRYKNLSFNDITDFVNPVKSRINKRGWESSLSAHMPAGTLPDFEDAYKEVELFINKILNS